MPIGIVYVAYADLSKQRANVLAIKAMCEALIKVNKKEQKLALIVPKFGNFTEDYTEPISLLTKKIHAPSWFCILEFSLKATFIILKNNVRDVYTRDILTGFWCTLFGKNVIFEAHSLQGINIVTGNFLRLFPHIVTITKNLRDDLISLYSLKESKISVIPSGLDTEIFTQKNTISSAKRYLKITPEKYLVMYAGSMLPWKGVHTLISAKDFLPEDFEIYLIGKGSSQFMQPRITCLEQLPQKQLATYLEAADVFVIPNIKKEVISERHTSPLKLLEALSLMKNIVVSDLPSIREIVDERQVTFFEPDNPESLAKKIVESVGATKVFFDVTPYEWNVRAQKILDIFRI